MLLNRWHTQILKDKVSDDNMLSWSEVSDGEFSHLLGRSVKVAFGTQGLLDELLHQIY
jgi:hypothetical protein